MSALETKFDSFSHEPLEGNKRKKPTDYCKKTGKWAQGHDESACLRKQRDEADATLQAIKERRAGKGRQATTSEEKAFAAGAIINQGAWCELLSSARK